MYAGPKYFDKLKLESSQTRKAWAWPTTLYHVKGFILRVLVYLHNDMKMFGAQRWIGKNYQVSPLTREECPTKLGVMYLQSKRFALGWKRYCIVGLVKLKQISWLTNQSIQHDQKVQESRKKYIFICWSPLSRRYKKMRINVFFILISESSAYILSYRSIYSQVNTVGYFNVLSEILFTNSWTQSFAKLPIPKLSLHNSAAFLSSAKASQISAWRSNFLTYTLASLNYTLSVSEYVTTNVTAKLFKFLHETNNQGCQRKISVKSQTVLK